MNNGHEDRINDLAEMYGCDIGKAIRVKNEFNKTRPYRHGGKAL